MPAGFDIELVAGPPEVQTRLKLLEQHMKGFYYWFALKGIALPVPTDKLVCLLVDQPSEFLKQRAVVERLEAIAKRKGVTPSQLALAWVLAQGEDVIPIPGTKRRKYLEENAAAVNIKLTEADIQELEAAIPLNEIVGDRYNAGGLNTIDR